VCTPGRWRHSVPSEQVASGRSWWCDSSSLSDIAERTNLLYVRQTFERISVTVQLPNSVFHDLATFLTHPVIVTIGPEVIVGGAALIYKHYGDRAEGRDFWRLGNELVTGAVGFFASGLLLFGARADAVLKSGSAESRQFVHDFIISSWVFVLIFVLLFLTALRVSHYGRGKSLILDPSCQTSLAWYPNRSQLAVSCNNSTHVRIPCLP